MRHYQIGNLESFSTVCTVSLVTLSQKSDNSAYAVSMKQPLDDSFRGSEMVISTGITAGEARAVERAAVVQGHSTIVDRATFTDVFEIAASELKSTWSVNLAIHLIEDQHPLTDLKGMMPGAAVVKQETYGDGAPWIVVTFTS